MNKLLQSERRMPYSGVIAMLLIATATPACTTSRGFASATVPAYLENSSVRQQNAVTPRASSKLASSAEQLAAPNFSDPLLDAIHDEADDESCTNAVYWADEPNSSTMTPVSTEAVEKMCNDELIACFRRCMNNPKPPWPAQTKGDRSHHEHCNKKCNKAHRACLQKAGLLQTFSAFDAAWSWIKSHGKEIVGTIVIIGGVAYIVSTGGSGALVLVVL